MRLLYVWLDATYLKVRRNHGIVSVGVIMAVGVNADGRREVLGMDIGRKSTPRMRSTSDFCAGVLFW
jgi:transposase-like protein